MLRETVEFLAMTGKLINILQDVDVLRSVLECLTRGREVDEVLDQ